MLKTVPMIVPLQCHKVQLHGIFHQNVLDAQKGSCKKKIHIYKIILHLLNSYLLCFTPYFSRIIESDNVPISLVSRHKYQLKQSFHCTNLNLVHIGAIHAQDFSLLIFETRLISYDLLNPQWYTSNINISNQVPDILYWNILVFSLNMKDVVFIELIRKN